MIQFIKYRRQLYRLAGSNWGLAPSGSGPDSYNVKIQNLEALQKLSKLFPDMLESKWLTDDLATGPTSTNIQLRMRKETSKNWSGPAWWNDMFRGIELTIKRIDDLDDNQKLQTYLIIYIDFIGRPSRLSRWYAKKLISGRKFSHGNIDANAEAIWALRLYLDGYPSIRPPESFYYDEDPII